MNPAPAASQQLQFLQFSVGPPGHLFMDLQRCQLFPRPRDSRRIKAVHIQSSLFSTPLTHSKFLLSDSHCPAIIVLEQSHGSGRNNLGKTISQIAHHHIILVPSPEIPLSVLPSRRAVLTGCPTVTHSQHCRMEDGKAPSASQNPPPRYFASYNTGINVVLKR